MSRSAQRSIQPTDKSFRRTRIAKLSRVYLHLFDADTMRITAHGQGEIAFGTMQAGIELEHSRTLAFFAWESFAEKGEIRG